MSRRIHNHIEVLETALNKLNRAQKRGSSTKRLLSLWSQFIRCRDGYACILCESEYKISAHHIVRKCFIPGAQLETGNGITLCAACHKDVHKGFNGKPDMNLLVDEQGGEKCETILMLYASLLDIAKVRSLLRDDFYYVSDHMLAQLKKFQGYDIHTPFYGETRLEEALRIWAASPLPMITAMLGANIKKSPTNF